MSVTKFPYAPALEVARALQTALRPYCERIEIVGSLRRERAFVGDLELLYVPQVAERPDHGSLFGELVPVNFADEKIAALEKAGVLARRRNIAGHETFGKLIKLLLHRSSSIPVDLFSATRENWFNLLVCRTGPTESNIAISSAALALGWEWQPYSAGFHRIGFTKPMLSERQVFDHVGLPYLDPKHRL